VVSASPSTSETLSAAAAYLFLPLPVIVAQGVCWAYLVTGNGGQDVSGMASVIATLGAFAPWRPDEGLALLGALLYVAYVVGSLALLARGLLSRSAHVRQHSRRALAYAVLMAPAVLQLPYVLGITVSLPVNGFSVVEGMKVVGGNPAGTLARFTSGIAFSGVVLPLPLGPLWRGSMVSARQGGPPVPILRKHWIGMGIAACIAAFVFVAAFFVTV
jgi:hypothetical protein